MNPTDALLVSLRRFAPIPDSEWRFAVRQIRPRRLLRGAYLTRAGEVAQEFGWVVRGLIRKYYVDEKGCEAIRGFAAEGQLAGAYASLLRGAPSELSVQAMEDTDLLSMDFAEWLKLYDRHVCWQALGRKVAEGLVLEREDRESQLLRLSATERYLRFQHEFPGLMGRVPQHQIAAYLRITPVSLSRIIGRLKRPRAEPVSQGTRPSRTPEP